MNDRFTEKARNAIEKARAAAMELGHSYIGTEHLLLGIVRETDALGSRVLRENGFEEDLVMDLIEKAAGRGAPGMPVQGLTPRCRRVIEIAVAEANRLRHSYVGTEHLLMGILREPESTAAHLLTAAGGDLNKIDLRIKDISDNSLFPSVNHELTASNFGKLSDIAGKHDIALGIANMVAETIAMVSIFAARGHGLRDIVLTGNLSCVSPVRKIIMGLSESFGVNFVCPDNAQFATVIGAALLGLDG